MIPNDNLTLGIAFFVIVLLTLMLWASTQKLISLRAKNERLRKEIATIKRPIPKPEKETIVDLIYEHKFTNDELLSFNIKEDDFIAELKKEAAKQFVNELIELKAIQVDAIREPYHHLPNHYRFIAKIVLKDEK